MIVGIGVDVVDVERFGRSLERTPALRDRLFRADETVLRDGSPRTVRSLAARFAAKEAVVKALGGSTGVAWHDLVVSNDAEGAPSLALTGGAARLAAARGADRVHLSLSHDAGVAVAYVVAESAAPAAAPAPAASDPGKEPRP